jgi:hypothetical protein
MKINSFRAKRLSEGQRLEELFLGYLVVGTDICKDRGNDADFLGIVIRNGNVVLAVLHSGKPDVTSSLTAG